MKKPTNPKKTKQKKSHGDLHFGDNSSSLGGVSVSEVNLPGH